MPESLPSSYQPLPVVVAIVFLGVLFSSPRWVRDAPDERHHQRGEQRDDVDDDAMLNFRPRYVFDVDEISENLDERNARDGQGDLDLQNTRVNVIEPLRA